MIKKRKSFISFTKNGTRYNIFSRAPYWGPDLALNPYWELIL